MTSEDSLVSILLEQTKNNTIVWNFTEAESWTVERGKSRIALDGDFGEDNYHLMVTQGKYRPAFIDSSEVSGLSELYDAVCHQYAGRMVAETEEVIRHAIDDFSRPG